MATIRGESSDQTVKAAHVTDLEKIYLELPNNEIFKFNSCDLQATIEALQNVKRLMTATLGSDSLK